MRKLAGFFFLAFLFYAAVSSSGLAAVEYIDGRIRLVIDEKIGRFSLYYMTDVDKKTWEPLFWDKDKRTSFLSVFIDGKEYKLGENSTFKRMIRGTENKPVLAFESEFFSVAEEFSFIRTASSGVSNGIRIDVTLENWNAKPLNIGLRLLIDSYLGEKTDPNFRTDLRSVGDELIIDRTTLDQYWLSRNDKFGLMGSIFVDGVESPDFIQFANWKRMNDSRFKVEYVQGRNFTSLPFSIHDSAVCYFLNVMPMERWGQRRMTVLLAAEDPYGFDNNKLKYEGAFERFVHEERRAETAAAGNAAPAGNDTPIGPNVTQIAANPSINSAVAVSTPPVSSAPTLVPAPAPVPVPAPAESAKRKKNMPAAPIGSMRIDLNTLRELVYRVDQYIYSGNMPSEEELKAMELTLSLLKARYGAVFNTF
jgi:hypothetical protein